MSTNAKLGLRLQQLLAIMRKGKYVNHNIFNRELTHTWNVKPVANKTFYRDIRKLQNLAAPIEYDFRAKGFYLTDMDWTVDDIPTVQGDMKLLLLSEKVSHSFMPPQLRGELSNAINALLMKNETGMPDGMNLDNFQIITPEFAPQVNPEVFLEVYQAWENKHYLKIYYSSNSGNDSVKLIEPHVLAWDSGIWYIKGFVVNNNFHPCEPPYKIRVFALHRISKAEKKEGHFTVVDEDTKRIKQSGLFDFQLLEEVEIEFFQPFVKQISERFSSRSEAIISRDENSVRIRLQNIPEYAVLRLIFLAQANVKVHKPATLQDTLLQIAQTIQSNMM